MSAAQERLSHYPSYRVDRHRIIPLVHPYPVFYLRMFADVVHQPHISFFGHVDLSCFCTLTNEVDSPTGYLRQAQVTKLRYSHTGVKGNLN